MKDIIIIDLDGTLCNDAHRNNWAQMKEWDTFHSLCDQDTIHEDVRCLIEMIPENKTVIAITGRDDRWRSKTLDHLADNDIGQFIDVLLMRPNGDYRKSGELKIALLEEWFATEGVTDKPTILSRVMFAIDDQEKVVEAFRNYGIAAWQVRA